MQLSDLNSKPHGGKCLMDIIDRVIGVQLYPPPVSENYKLLCINMFHLSTIINYNNSNND